MISRSTERVVGRRLGHVSDAAAADGSYARCASRFVGRYIASQIVVSGSRARCYISLDRPLGDGQAQTWRAVPFQTKDGYTRMEKRLMSRSCCPPSLCRSTCLLSVKTKGPNAVTRGTEPYAVELTARGGRKIGISTRRMTREDSLSSPLASSRASSSRSSSSRSSSSR